LSVALDEAFRRAAELQRQAQLRVAGKAKRIRSGLAHRVAAEAAPAPATPSVLRPVPETSEDVRSFVRAEFREAQKKRSGR
jgi:hypothetical protein